ncbi:MAG: histidine kinase dimerization/phospho-acceptor domain-containing protein [Bdellovibrionota bacterium]
MPALRNSFLLVGPWPVQLQDVGATIQSDLTHTIKKWVPTPVDVLGISVTSLREKKFQNFYESLIQNNIFLQIIAIAPADYSSKDLLDLHRKYRFFTVLNSFNEAQIENSLYLALEKAQNLKQQENLEKLIHEQNEDLSHLYRDLEERVEKRSRFLMEARRKLFVTNSRIESFRKTLLSIHEAKSVPEIEKYLNDSLNGSLKTSWIRILFTPQDQFFHQQVSSQLQFNQLQIPLFSQNIRIGSVFFMRAPEQKFIREETDFLTRVSEAVALSLDRISKTEELEEIKDQWESTFNAMAEPIALIDENYEIIQANKSFHGSSNENKKSKQKLKCHEILFNSEKICDGCHIGQNFRLSDKKNSKNFEVTSQTLRLEGENKTISVNLYKDVSNNLKMERLILETAKLAELGTISSSIAHELNNPLGGILTFAQLIKMDLDSRDPLYPDIVEIEKGAQRCRDIIQNMLVFTRNPEVDTIQELDLGEVLHRAYKIMELQTKSLGIDIQMIQAVPPPRVVGHRNLLAQAFKSLMQIALETLRSDSENQKNNRKIVIQIFNNENGTEITFMPFVNSLTIMNSSQNYSWSMASQILKEQNAELEISSMSSRVSAAKISFSRPVLRS